MLLSEASGEIEEGQDHPYVAELTAIAAYIEGMQLPNGGWDYPAGTRGGTTGDTSVVQYALLGLWAATRSGVQSQVNAPVLLLTARVTVADRVMGLDLGADDYLTKPFAFEELLARVRALLRRGTTGPAAVLAVADLRLDPVKREVTRGDKRIELTSKEFALLEFLLRRRDQVLSRAVIAQHVWGVNYDTFTNVIDVYVNYLRKKIDSGFEPKLIHTVRGAGYVLKEEP
jgi:DNA-binding response OmpR family regulator